MSRLKVNLLPETLSSLDAKDLEQKLQLSEAEKKKRKASEGAGTGLLLVPDDRDRPLRPRTTSNPRAGCLRDGWGFRRKLSGTALTVRFVGCLHKQAKWSAL